MIIFQIITSEQFEASNRETIPTTVTDLEQRKSNETQQNLNTSQSINPNPSKNKPYRPIVDITNGTIRSYAGLSATTQERIRKFEQETRAMLARRRLEEDNKQRVSEMEWMSTTNQSPSTSEQISARPNSFGYTDTSRYRYSSGSYISSETDSRNDKSKCSVTSGSFRNNNANGTETTASDRIFLRRGSSVENVNYVNDMNTVHERNSSSNTTSVSNGTLKRLKTGKETVSLLNYLRL